MKTKDIHIAKKTVRHIVPFSFRANTRHLAYYDLYHDKKEGEPSTWEPVELPRAESDFIEHLAGDGEVNRANTCDAVKMTPEAAKAILPKFVFSEVHPSESKEVVPVSIVDVGIYLFSLGVGFLWYDMDIDTDSAEQLIRVNNRLKEFSYDGKICCWIKEEKEGDTYRTLNLGKWILDQTRYVVTMEYFFAGSWGVRRARPNKAISYLSIMTTEKAEREELLQYLFRMAQGASEGYSISPEYLQNEEKYFLRQYENVTWSCAEEGCVRLMELSEEQENREFLENNFQDTEELYFFPYMLVLHQYYALLKMDRTQVWLPKKRSLYQDKDEREDVLDYLERMQFFYTNCVHTKVSYVAKFNEVYSYFKQTYKLNELLAEMKDKVNVLYKIDERWRERQKEKKSIIWGLIGVIFVLSQVLNNVLELYGVLPYHFNMTLFEFTGVVVGGVVLLVAVVVKFFKGHL